MEVPYVCVSIPSSSGHQFTGDRRPADRHPSAPVFQSLLHQGISLLLTVVSPGRPVIAGFQSLLHQGISLLDVETARQIAACHCFNPFFIRASVYCRGLRHPGQLPHRGFNPFFIRASVYWVPSTAAKFWVWKEFQSLLHQGISLLGVYIDFPGIFFNRRFNPFFIRASVYWRTAIRFPACKGQKCFNPFFIRASVYCKCLVNQLRSDKCVSIPSSSGHQFTGFQEPLVAQKNPPSFNPFFIRASVYWHSGVRWTPVIRLGFNPFFIRASVY